MSTGFSGDPQVYESASKAGILSSVKGMIDSVTMIGAVKAPE
jgi:hypothetical protein